MFENFTVLQFVALAIAIVCGVIDFKTTKIPNLITFPATVLGWILSYIYGGGWPAVGSAVLGSIIGVALSIAPKLLDKKRDPIGFGDAKLLMAMGAFLGWVGVLLVWFYFSLAWGVIAVVRFVSVLPLKSLMGAIFAKQAGGNLLSAETARKVQKVMQDPIPVAPAIAAGVLLSELWGKETLKFMGF